jgi:hypothetical protein
MTKLSETKNTFNPFPLESALEPFETGKVIFQSQIATFPEENPGLWPSSPAISSALFHKTHISHYFSMSC